MTGQRQRVYIGLGSNLNNPCRQVLTAMQQLAELPRSGLVARSSLYQSTPMGPPDQPLFINAVAALETALSPEELLAHLQTLETKQGRVRGRERWGPRALDLDILLYGDRQVCTDTLVIPHYGIKERSFVLYPLAEIAPDIRIPGLGSIDELLARCPPAELTRLE